MTMPDMPFNPEFSGRPELKADLTEADEELCDFIDQYYEEYPGATLMNSRYEGSEAIDNWIKRIFMVLDEGNMDVEFHQTTEATVHFALTVAFMRSPKQVVKPNLDELVMRMGDDTNREADVMKQLAGEYAKRHPADMGILLAFMSEVNPTGTNMKKVQEIYGFVMDAIERQKWEDDLIAELGPGFGDDVVGEWMDGELALMTMETQSDMSVDMATVRDTLLQWRDTALPAIERAFATGMGREIDLNNPDDVAAVAIMLRDAALNNWAQLENAPMEGDIIVASGKGIVMPFRRADDGRASYSCRVLGEKTEIRGTFRGFTVQPYIDGAVLDVEEDDQEDATSDMEHPYGFHFVIDDVVVIDGDPEDDGNAECYNIPLEYPEMKVHAIKLD